MFFRRALYPNLVWQDIAISTARSELRGVDNLDTGSRQLALAPQRWH